MWFVTKTFDFPSQRGLCVKQTRADLPGCVTPEAPFLPSNMSSSVNVSPYGPPSLHYAVSTSTESPTRFYRHLPIPLETFSTTNPLWQIPKSGVIARQQHSVPDNGVTVKTAGGATETRKERNRPSVLFHSARPEGDRRRISGVNSEVENIELSHTSGPQSPLRSDCQPNSPAESSSCSRGAVSPQNSVGEPGKVRNWKKYKFIVLNSTDGMNGHGSQTQSHAVTEGTKKSGEDATRSLGDINIRLVISKIVCGYSM